MTLQEYRMKNQTRLESAWLKLNEQQQKEWGNFTHFVASKWADVERGVKAYESNR